jgi:hypothetical protein
MEARAEQARRNQEALEKRLKEEEAERLLREEEDRKLSEQLAREAKYVDFVPVHVIIPPKKIGRKEHVIIPPKKISDGAPKQFSVATPGR